MKTKILGSLSAFFAGASLFVAATTLRQLLSHGAGVHRDGRDSGQWDLRRPFLNTGEDRRPTLSWPRNIPIDGEPADVVAVVDEYRGWLENCDVPKLFVNAEPGAILNGRIRDYVRTWANLSEITVPGVHFIQEDSPDEIGVAVAQFVRRLR